MGQTSNSKGNRFELEARTLLRRWWGCPFERTTTHHGSTKKDLPGDLVAINPAIQCPFCIEAKHDEAKIRLEPHMHNPGGSLFSSALEQAWAQAEEMEHGLDLIPALLCKRNFQPVLFVWPHELDLGVERMMLRWDRKGFDGLSLWVSVAPFEAVSALPPAEVSRIARAQLLSYGPTFRPWRRTRRG